MIVTNLPALQVILALIAAPMCSMLYFRHVAWFFSVIVTFVLLVISLFLFMDVFADSPIRYEMGGWIAPIGIEYNIDKLSVSMLLLVNFIAFVACFFSKATVEQEIQKEKHSFFYAAFLLCLTGLLGMIVTNDAFNIYVFLEISSLASYALIAMGRDKRALVSSFEYLVLGTVGATFILIAVGMLYMMTGTLNISDLYSKLSVMEDSLPVKAALAFFIAGLALKIAMFPMHLWLTNSYTNSPTFVAVFLSATSTKVSIYVLIRVIFSLFGYEYVFKQVALSEVIIVLSVAGMIVGSVLAIFQNNLKRLLAYSSVSQVGYIILAVGLATSMSLNAALINIFAHALAKATLFMAVGCFALRIGSERLAGMSGLAKSMPVTTVVFVIAGLSLIGVPGTVGFVSKFYLLRALVEQQMWVIFALVLLSSLLAIAYVWKVVEILYYNDGAKKATSGGVQEAPASMLVPMCGMTLLIILFGVYGEPVVDKASEIVEFLLGRQVGL